MPMGDIIRRSALKYPDKTALVYGDRMSTYRELNLRVNRLANALLDRGLRKRDRIAVLFHNSIEFIELYFASAKSGGIFVPINNLLRENELKRVLQYIEPRLLFVDHNYQQIIENFRDEIKTVEVFVGLNGVSSPSFIPYDQILQQGDVHEPELEILDGDVMSIFLTSGTTGLPKGAMRTHRHNYNTVMVGAIELGLLHDDRPLLLFPFYHVTFEDSIRHFLMGNTVVIRKEGHFDPKEVLYILSKEKITLCQFVPTMINALLQVERIDQYDLRFFRLLLYAASPMPVELLKQAMKKFKCQFLQMYGQTETGPETTILRPEDHILEGTEAQLKRLASAGRPVLNYEVRIVDEKGNDVPVGEVGELIVRSESMTIGYWNLPEETAKTIKGGWLHTGDFARFDKEGYVYIVDRKHDMIISGGKNIYPREIEELLYRHEAILEAAVIGVPDGYWGESVKALVVLKEGMEASEEEIIDFCKDNLASYKKPKSVEFRKELPKSPTGKILKRVIREAFWKNEDRRV